MTVVNPLTAWPTAHRYSAHAPSSTEMTKKIAARPRTMKSGMGENARMAVTARPRSFRRVQRDRPVARAGTSKCTAARRKPSHAVSPRKKTLRSRSVLYVLSTRRSSSLKSLAPTRSMPESRSNSA